MAVDREGRDRAAEIDLGDAAGEHDHRPDRCIAIGRHEGAFQLQLGAVERALHASGEEGQTVRHIPVCGITSKTSVSTSTPIFQWHLALLLVWSMRGPCPAKRCPTAMIASARRKSSSSPMGRAAAPRPVQRATSDDNAQDK